MIIVSQNKDNIINFDNLTQDEEEKAYFIRFETVDSLYEDLGEYDTEERAEEVLRDIVHWYEIDAKVYRMPEV
jgi:hypothetical protein